MGRVRRKHSFSNRTGSLLQVPFKRAGTSNRWVFLHQGGRAGAGWRGPLGARRGGWHLPRLLAPTEIWYDLVKLYNHCLTSVGTSPLLNLRACIALSALFPRSTQEQRSPSPHSRLCSGWRCSDRRTGCVSHFPACAQGGAYASSVF